MVADWLAAFDDHPHREHPDSERENWITIYLVFSVRKGSVQTPAKRVKLFHLVEVIGRWSMIDVFVVTFTVALIQLQPFMSVEPAAGIFFFAAVVVLTMMAVESFDARLIWDPVSSQPTQKI